MAIRSQIKSQIKRAVCAGLAVSMVLSAGMEGLAAPGTPACDESLYVTMDPYGTVTETSVVKSYVLHGARQIVDHGTYRKINNMTDYSIPTVDGERVVFSLEEAPDHDRFYFEGILDPEETGKTLPWTISVSYRLNGVEKTMGELAHEKGLVEIAIDAVPNEAASDYYRNNMSMEIVSIVDMDQNLSVEAPGAQIQSAGSMKAVLFMVMPGEEQHFELRIGSDDFEFSGLMILMTPVTLSQLDRLDDLRDMRDTVKDSADAVSDSLDIILDSLEGLSAGLQSTAAGLKKLDASRQIISGTKEAVYVDADEALAVLKELSERGVPFTGYMDEARNALSDANRELNSMNGTLQELDEDLEDLRFSLRHVSRDLNELSELLGDTGQDIREYEKMLTSLRKDLEELLRCRDALNEKILRLKEIISSLRNLEQQLKEQGSIPGLTEEQKEALTEAVGVLIGELPGEGQDIAEAIIASYSDALEQALEDAASVHAGAAQQGLAKLIMLLEALVGKLEQPSKLEMMIRSVTEAVSLLEDTIRRVEEDGESLEYVLEDTADLADSLRHAAPTGQNLISDVDRLTDILNRYHGTADQALSDTGLLIETAVRGTDAMYVLLSETEKNLKAAGTPLDQGAKLTTEGLTDALETAIRGLSETGVIREAKDTVKDLINEKWDEYTGEDMTILNIDTDARKISFTSVTNPEPQSLQIILRTEGTAETEDEEEALVDEEFHAQGNFFMRLWSILVKIVETVKGVFLLHLLRK